MVTKLRRSDDQLPEVLFDPRGDNAQAQRLSRLNKAGQLRQLRRGLYTTNLRATDADVVARNWPTVLAALIPGAVVSHRSVIDARPENGVLYFTRAAGKKASICRDWKRVA